MAETKIEYVTHTVNPIRVKGGKVWKHGYHCTKISPGCAHCYAEGLNIMRGTGLPYDNRKVEFYLDLSVFDTLPKTKSCMVFVQSMGDLFHEDVPTDYIEKVMLTIYDCPDHTFLILTKRPERLQETRVRNYFLNCFMNRTGNIWLGVTAENQEQADKRIPILLEVKALAPDTITAFVSIEPMLGGADIEKYLMSCVGCGNQGSDFYPLNKIGEGNRLCQDACIKHGEGPSLDWIILGAESGPKRRYCDTDDMLATVRQCHVSNIPVFVKQIHLWKNSSRLDWGFYVEKDIAKFPPQLQLRQHPAEGRE